MNFQKIKLQMIRETSEDYCTDPITSPIDIVDFINRYEEYNLSPNEKIIVIGLDTKNKINIYTEIATGAPGYANFNVSEVFKPLLISNSSKFILAHNHPSGNSNPSKEDIMITKQLMDASHIMGINFLDHIIIGEGNYTSIISKLKEEK